MLYAVTSSGKSIMPNCSQSSGIHPRARTMMNDAVDKRLYNSALFSMRDSINGCPWKRAKNQKIFYYIWNFTYPVIDGKGCHLKCHGDHVDCAI